jgi:branched-chain amino acid transport system ATP-binding protein
MLTVRGLEVFYGPIRALRGIDLDVGAGEIVALIGANGAGKTTAVRAIAGLIPFRGAVSYDGKPLRPNSAEANLRAGLSLVPEGRGILGRMTVEDNLLMGVYCRDDRAAAARDIEHMFERFPILRERRGMLASLLSGGEQQMLALGRALMSKPKLILLDEPSLGLAPKMVTNIFQKIREITEQNVAAIIVDQNAVQAMALATRVCVVRRGELVYDAAVEQAREELDVVHAHLGIS